MIDKIIEDVKPKRKVLILTHNNPDPDTIAAAHGLKSILVHLLKKRVTIGYSGLIGRSENRELVKTCKIELHLSHKLNFNRYDYLVVVDTQPTAGNCYIQKGHFPDVIIDHHNLRAQTKQASVVDVRTSYGATSTIICEYLKHLGMEADANTATALYYGIKTDTVGSARSNTQADVDMMAFVFPKVSLQKLNKIENPDLPRYYFKNIKKAVESAVIMKDLVFCDLGDVRNADLIAEMADFLLRMRDVKWGCVIGKIDDNAFFSLRCKSNRRRLGLLAMTMVKGMGTGGGHLKSAGGQIPLTGRNYAEVVDVIKRRLVKRIGAEDAEAKSI